MVETSRDGGDRGQRGARSPRVLPGLRARLTVLIASLLVVALGVLYVSTYHGTGAQVRDQIDRDLRQDTGDFVRAALPSGPLSPAAVAQAARAYVRAQPSFGPSARLLLVQAVGQPAVTNEPETLGLRADDIAERESPADQREEDGQAMRLRTERPGSHTLRLEDAGPVRLLVSRVVRGGSPIATFTIGEPLDAVRRAQAGLAGTFLVTGTLVLLAALTAGWLVAGRFVRPLRRMAATAAEIDAGELGRRLDAHGPRDEIRILADAFDRMLDRLQDAFARQREFVADASHELRTPLTIIRGQLEVLARQDKVARDDVRHVEGQVRGEIERMQRLVDDLSLLTRADEGDFLAVRSLDLAGLLDEQLAALAPLADRRLEHGPLAAGELRGDPDRLAQVLRNLLGNAIEHTEPGGVIRLSARDATQPGTVEIEVEDDGPGIPEPERERIFDRFHRTDRARSRAAGGTGLGLAIAQALVVAHGGRIKAARSPLGGALVTVTLPGWRSRAAGRPSPADEGALTPR